MVEPLTIAQKKGEHNMTSKEVRQALIDVREYVERQIADGMHVEWKRLAKCQAWYWVWGGMIFLKSYDTIVAVYSGQYDTLFSYGRYSNTTYQHIRKFRNTCTPHMWETKEENLQAEDLWGCFSSYRW